MPRLLLAALLLALTVPAAAQSPYGPPGERIETVTAAGAAQAQDSLQRRENWGRVRPAAIAVLLIDAADIVTTHACAKSPRCHEGNRIYGSRNPSLGTILAIKGAQMAATWLIAREASERSPAAGFTFLGARAIGTGTAVLANLNILW